MCSGETRVFTVTPPSGFPTNYGFDFYVQGTSSSLLIENQVTSQQSPYSTSSNQVTVSCPGQAYGSAFVLARMHAQGCTPSGYVNIEPRAGVYNNDEFSIYGPGQVCPNASADFNSSYINGDILDFQWTAPSGWSSSGNHTPYFHVSVLWSFSGGEAITLKLQNRCGLTNTPAVKPLFARFNCGSFFTINENPVSDELVVNNMDSESEISAKLVNDHAKPVRSTAPSKRIARIDVRDIPEGIYVLEVRSFEKVERRRIVVQH